MYQFAAFEMTLEEGLNLEKRFFHQTFGTVSILRNFGLFRKLKVMMSFRCNDNPICICNRLLHLLKTQKYKGAILKKTQ